MSRIVQPSIAKRITFATWARTQGLNRHSSATWTVPESVDIPEPLLVGAQVDGKPYAEPKAEPKPKRTRTRVRKDTGPVEEPAPEVAEQPVIRWPRRDPEPLELETPQEPQPEPQEDD